MPIESVTTASLLVSDVALSFWGGIDPLTADVIDEHHPLHGENVAGRIVAVPGSRGSCSGSGLLLEIIMTGKAPAALVFCEQEEILVLGALVAKIMFDHGLPLIRLNSRDFAQLRTGHSATISDNVLSVSCDEGHKRFEGIRLDTQNPSPGSPLAADIENALVLSSEDREKSAGKHGKAVQVAMQILLAMARIQGARDLITITQAHIDSCVYHGPSSLAFAQRLVEWGASVAVPTTLNAVSVDKRRWQSQGIDPAFGHNASALGDAFMAMGAQLSYTCAPYLLDTAPGFGEQIVWAESNAVAYANSILGARTRKYPDFLDACIALTGRAPNTGAHLNAGRLPTLRMVITPPPQHDDAYWPLLGYHVGLLATSDIPFITGLESTSPTTDHLKAFSAAFATTSSAPLFHLHGITPEAREGSLLLANTDTGNLPTVAIKPQDLSSSWNTLNSADSSQVDMICLGNPHFSISEVESLATLCEGRIRSPDVMVVVTLGRAVYEHCHAEGMITMLDAFGVQWVNDTCWCMLQQPVIPPPGSVLMTTSAKYAHYAPGLVSRSIHFGSLSDCVDAACDGERLTVAPDWLSMS